MMIWWEPLLNCKTHLAHAVICKFDVSLWVQQHIVQFQISVDDSPLVEVVERKTNLCGVEPEEAIEQFFKITYDCDETLNDISRIPF